MSPRKFFVGGNWKMNNLKADNEKLIELLNGAKINYETTGKHNELYEIKGLKCSNFSCFVNRGPSGSTSPLRRLRSHSIGQANPRRGAELLQSREGRFHWRHQPGHDQGQRR